MDAARKEVIDGLFQGKISIEKAAEILNVSEDAVHKMIDEYEYAPTPTEIIEANKIIQENIDYIEREVFISYKRSVPQNLNLTDATEILGKCSETKKIPIIDATGIIKSDLITAGNANALNPYEHKYHW